MVFGDWLRRQIERSELTEAEVGIACGVSQQAVSRWLAGSAHPRGQRISQLARLLGVRTQTVLAQLASEMEERAATPPDEREAAALEAQIAALRLRLEQAEQRAARLAAERAATRARPRSR